MAKMRDGHDPGTHDYMVKCETEGCKRKKDPLLFAKRPLAAVAAARRHANRAKQHAVIVIDLTTLEVAHRYCVEIYPVWTGEPPF